MDWRRITVIFAPIMTQRQNDYLSRFRAKGAFSPESAVFLQEIGLMNNVIIRRLVRERILAKTADRRYYLLTR